MTTSSIKLPRSFTWLNATQFLGALNDNVFKLLVVYFITYQFGARDDTKLQAALMAQASVLFVLPFLLFSHAGGVLADRYSKRSMVVILKVAEIVIMLGGLLAVAFTAGKIAKYATFGLVFMMCAQSAFFGPSKYGIIPELTGKDNLSKANSLLVGATYLAIILGGFVPSLFLTCFPFWYAGLAVLCVLIAVSGTLTSLVIEKTPSADRIRNFTLLFVRDIYRTLKDVSFDRLLFLAIIGSAYFMFLGAFIQINTLLYGQEYISLSQEQSGFLFPVAALGIGAGALLVGKISGRNIELGIVPMAAIGLTVCCVALGFLPKSVIAVVVVVLALGMSCGMYIVPLDAFIQFKSPRARLGEIIAVQNFLGFTGAALGALTFWFFSNKLGFKANQSFVVIGILTGVLAIAAVAYLPYFFLRVIIITIARSFYKIVPVGLENIPTEGSALLVSNHVTYLDPFLIGTVNLRPIRYMMDRDIHNKFKWFMPFFKFMKTILISNADPPRKIIESLREARAALDNNELVCVFAEGSMTRTGNLRPFRPGLERIVKGSNYPIIPVYIDGAWGSIFSYYNGNLFSSLPKSSQYPVTIQFGKPLPAASSVQEVQDAVVELSVKAFELKKP